MMDSQWSDRHLGLALALVVLGGLAGWGAGVALAFLLPGGPVAWQETVGALLGLGGVLGGTTVGWLLVALINRWAA